VTGPVNAAASWPDALPRRIGAATRSAVRRCG
jgi:hypothetical protein